MSLDKLKNWQQSVEIDYLSLYIKTWFAFLSSLKELHPTINSPLGDGRLINHYIDNMTLPPNYDNEIRPYIEKAFNFGKTVIERDLPEYYFRQFYSINKTFQSGIIPGLSNIRFRIIYSNRLAGQRKANLFIDFKRIQAQFHTKFRLYNFTLGIEISEFITCKIYDSKDDCLNHIVEAMRNKVYDHIDDMQGLQLSGINIRQAYINTLLTEISQQWRPNFQLENLFQPQPVSGFPNAYDANLHKISVIKWFVKFSYGLRNILFHYIIDPFDEQWLKLFRHTYLALKEIVNHNIYKIENPPPAVVAAP